jgi:hypothetical protein
MTLINNDTQHNDTQHNDTQYCDTQPDTQPYDTQHDDISIMTLSTDSPTTVKLSDVYAQCHLCCVSKISPLY